MYMSMDVHGAKAIEKALRTLPDKVARRVVRKAVRAGGNVLLKEVRRRVPKAGEKAYMSALSKDARAIRRGHQKEAKAAGGHFPGYLRWAISLFKPRGDRRGVYSLAVGTRPGLNEAIRKYSNRGGGAGRHWYPAAVEYGHKGAPAYPYMRPAFETKRSEVEAVIDMEMWKGIRRAWETG